MSAEQAFSKNLRRVRQNSGLSQAKLAEKAGVTERTILNLEKGEISANLTTVTLIAKALEVPPSHLLVEVEQ